MGHSRPLFYKQPTVNKCSINVADDWIQTQVLWCRKQPLCQLRHNHFPISEKQNVSNKIYAGKSVQEQSIMIRGHITKISYSKWSTYDISQKVSMRSIQISLNSAFIYKWLIELQEFCTKRCYTRKRRTPIDRIAD